MSKKNNNCVSKQFGYKIRYIFSILFCIFVIINLWKMIISIITICFYSILLFISIPLQFQLKYKLFIKYCRKFRFLSKKFSKYVHYFIQYYKNYYNMSLIK